MIIKTFKRSNFGQTSEYIADTVLAASIYSLTGRKTITELDKAALTTVMQAAGQGIAFKQILDPQL